MRILTSCLLAFIAMTAPVAAADYWDADVLASVLRRDAGGCTQPVGETPSTCRIIGTVSVSALHFEKECGTIHRSETFGVGWGVFVRADNPRVVLSFFTLCVSREKGQLFVKEYPRGQWPESLPSLSKPRVTKR